ncbi:hypothetical protein EDD22DRAFT_959690 [Suillus occidentalis]|nr:hypothetical protein EDD22DRAFT_959690 [Suillus occidentalis]
MSFSADYHTHSITALYDTKCYLFKGNFPCVMPLLGNLVGVVDTLPFVGYITVGQEPKLCPLYCSPSGLEAVQQHIRLTAYLETGRIHAPALEAECTEVPLYAMEGHIPPASLDLPAKWTRQGQDNKIHVVYEGIVDLANFRTIIHWADYPLGFNMPVFNFGSIPDTSEIYSTLSVNDHSLLNSWTLPDVNMASEGDGSFSAYSHHGASYPSHSAANISASYLTQAASDPALAASHALTVETHPNNDVAVEVISSQTTSNLKKIMKEYLKWRLVLAYLRLLFRVAICTGNTVNPHDITTSKPEVKAALVADLFAESLIRANTLEKELETVISNGLTISVDDVLVMAGKWVSQFIYDTARVADWAIAHREAGFELHDLFGPVLQAKLEQLLEYFIRPKSDRLPIEQNGLVWFFRSTFSKTLAWHIVFRTTRSKGILIHSTPHVPLVMADLEPGLFKNALHLPEDTLAYVASSLPGSLFITASVLFGLVDSHDLTPLLEIILGEVVKQMQLQQEETCTGFLKRGGRSFMEEMMYRAQMEVSLFSKAIANLCEELDTRNQQATGRPSLRPNLVPPSADVRCMEACLASHLPNFDPLQPSNDIQDKSYKKCQAWLLKSNMQDTGVSFDVSGTPPDSPHLHERFLRNDDQPPPLPRLMKAWVDNVTYRSYTSACLAESNEPLPTVKGSRFTRKEDKTSDVLISVFHILDLKKQRAQVEVDMLYDAIVRIAELEASDDDGTSSGTAATPESYSPDELMDDWFSTSSAPSDTF